MDRRAVDALVGRMAEFVQAFLERHPTPDPPPNFPSEVLRNASFGESDVRRWHFANGDQYQDFPHLSLADEARFAAMVRVWNARREFTGTSLPGIEKRLKRLVVDCLNAPARIGDLTESVVVGLQIQPQTDVLLPVVGVDLQVPEWRLAPDVTLIMMTPERFEQDVVGGYVRGASRAMPVYGDAEAYGRGVAATLRKAFIGSPVLVVRADGDEYLAQEAAEKRADIAVNALQFAAAVYHHQYWRTFIDWTGDVPASGWRFIVQIPVAGDVRPNNPGSRRGMLAQWAVDEEQLGKITADGVDEVIRATLADPAAEHQDMIRRAVGAFADGERQRSVDGKKLSYTTVFDIFYSMKEIADTTRSIREGVAFTMYYRASLDQRFEMAQFVNRVYDSRSRTSHEFETGVFEPKDLERLRAIAYNLIGVMSRRAPFTKADLRDELEAERGAMGADYARFEKLGRRSE